MRKQVLAVAVAVFSVAACSSDPDPRPPEPINPVPVQTATAQNPAPAPSPAFPGTTWDREERGDFAAVDDRLRADGWTCIAVVKDGKLVHDAYWNGGGPGKQQRVYSIAKSLTSLVAGTFADEGALDLDASASRHIDAWAGTPAESISARDLLSMTSGRRWSEAIDRQLITGSSDQSAFAVGLEQEHAPGQSWVYDNAAVQSLESLLDDLGETDDVVEIAQQRLLGPLGMRDTTWGRDAAANALTYSGMTSTCLDLARIGLLMVSEGRWNGQQILSADYIREATHPSSRLNAAYGLLWWTNAQGRIVEVLRQAGFATDKVPYRGRLAPHVPADAYWAFGYGNQYLAVVPSEGLVAVRLGARPASPDRVTFDSFTADVLAAVS